MKGGSKTRSPYDHKVALGGKLASYKRYYMVTRRVRDKAV